MDQQTIQELSSTGRHQECLKACQQLLQKEPESQVAWKYAGKSLLALRQFEKAQQCLTKAHHLDANDPETTKDIGNIFFDLGRLDEASEWYRKSLQINNNYATALNNLANAKRKSGSHKEAVDLFKRAIQEDPQLIQAHNGAAASLLALGDIDQAESIAIRAININKNVRGTNEILGTIFQKKKYYQKAAESYQKELDINPRSDTSLLNLGLVRLKQGEPAEAIEPLTRAAAIKPSKQCLLLLAEAYQSTGQLKEAILMYKNIDFSKSQSKIALYNLGSCLLKTSNSKDAIEAFRLAIKMDDAFLPAWTNLGTALQNEGRHKEALIATQKVLDLAPDNHSAYINLGGIYKELGNLNQALTSTLKSLELNPDNPTAHMNLGIIYTDLGNLNQALASTLKSVELNPDNPIAHMNLGGIYKDLGNFDQALASTLKSLELNPDNPIAHMNLGGIYKELGNLDQALASTLKSLELNPDNPTARMNLGGIYKDLGNLDQALASTLKSLELNHDNPIAHMNLGGIYKDLGNLDQALASTLKSLELKPETSKALVILGDIKLAIGKSEEARKHFLAAIENDPQEYGAYNGLSNMLETTEEAEELVKSINSAKAAKVPPEKRSLIEFALSNCFHKAENYDEASKFLQLANKNKLAVLPSNTKPLMQAIANSLSDCAPEETINISMSCGKERIFIVGMPRSGSTLLETILSMNPEIKDLGESRSLKKAISKMQEQGGEHKSDSQDLNEAYSQMEPFDNSKYTYTTDKQLYNFLYINHIATHMPAAKIIHCRRNPMDNILSMFRSNLSAGNNYKANLEDSAKVLVAQEQAMQIHKRRYPEKIFTYDYDHFVNAPEENLRKLLRWLDLEFNESYLHPEKSTRSVNTASVMQARKPISNKSVGGWKNYETLLKPAFKIIQESGFRID